MDIILDSPVAPSAGPAVPERSGVTSGWSTKWLVVGVDAAAIAMTATLAGLAWSDVRPGLASVERAQLVLSLLAVPLWIVCFARVGLYRARLVTGRCDELRRVARGVASGTVATAVAGFVLRAYPARSWVAIMAGLGVVIVATARLAMRQFFLRQRRRGRMLRSVVIVGGNDEAVAVADMLIDDAALGYDVAGFVDDEGLEAQLFGRRPMLGTLERTREVLEETGACGVIIATTAVSADTTNRLARDLVDLGYHVELSSSLEDVASRRLTLRPIGRFPMLYVEPARRAGWRALAKRTFDVVAGLAGLAIALPVILFVAIAVKLDSAGGVLFRQVRVGKDGRLFEVLKFRTMVTGAEAMLVDLAADNEADGPLFKLRNDPRVTRVGRILRKLSLDEVPQLWNVVRGEMSLVGPRPALPSEVAEWEPSLHGRLRVKPGITGMWQVSGRSNSSFDQYVRLDLYYVDNWSLWTDVAIVARTVPSVLFARGAY